LGPGTKKKNQGGNPQKHKCIGHKGVDFRNTGPKGWGPKARGVNPERNHRGRAQTKIENEKQKEKQHGKKKRTLGGSTKIKERGKGGGGNNL